ncbi:hypothetical protein CGRA01v4_06477 [Colletotrichum graminicola]|nr:hypothetical protein CGRA01v4_06477 [Colletotrichum graminicola]
MAYFNDFPERLKFFSPKERRDIIFYVCGIMLYRFGLEAFDGSITALATNRYDYESHTNGTPSRTFERLGLLQGLNQVTQCVGSILIAPLIKHYPTKNVLSSAILLFGLMTAILLILDAATGGTFVPAAYRKKHPKNEWPYYGKYDNDAIIPIYTIPGIAYGMVELIRRVIPRDIVGGSVQKLRQMDSLVHIFYEVAGVSGALLNALVLIPNLGNNRSFVITPICFTLAAVLFFFVVDDSCATPSRGPRRARETILSPSARASSSSSSLLGAALASSSPRHVSSGSCRRTASPSTATDTSRMA